MIDYSGVLILKNLDSGAYRLDIEDYMYVVRTLRQRDETGAWSGGELIWQGYEQELGNLLVRSGILHGYRIPAHLDVRTQTSIVVHIMDTFNQYRVDIVREHWMSGELSVYRETG